MKKTRILFFHFDLQGGGAEKVLVSLLNHLDPEKYDITLQTIFGAGVNKNALPPYVRHKFLFKKIFNGFNTIMKMLSPHLLHRLLVREHYDIEVAFLENSPTRIVSGCPHADTKKLAWVHIEIETPRSFLLGYRNRAEAMKCYNRFDKICFVAQTAQHSFESHFPEVTTPRCVIYNVNDYDAIYRLASQPIPVELSHGTINLCSVGRLVSQKRFDRLINVISRVKRDGFKVHLYILGQGENRQTLESQINSLDLNNEVTMLGFDPNPYKYVSQMDLFVCSSKKEGYNTAVTEAVALGVPVLTTRCSGMDEILRGGDFGMIVDNSEEALYIGLSSLLANPARIDEYRQAIAHAPRPTTKSLVDAYEALFAALQNK